MIRRRESHYNRYSCRATVVLVEIVSAESVEEAELIFEARLDALEEDDPSLHVESMSVM